MKVIDADKLIKDIQELWDYKTVDDITATTVLKQTITDIENQPTVKAIPVEWLINYEIKNGQEVRLQEAIAQWEKENETN